MKKIGLFGGSFNPIHKYHINIAEVALTALDLDQIIFIPTNYSPFKDEKDSLNKEHRCNMLELVMEDYAKFELSKFELMKEGPSYTINTVKYFLSKKVGSELFLIMGEDSFETINKWYSYREILNSTNIIVYPRLNSSYQEVFSRIPKIKFLGKENRISIYKIRYS